MHLGVSLSRWVGCLWASGCPRRVGCPCVLGCIVGVIGVGVCYFVGFYSIGCGGFAAWCVWLFSERAVQALGVGFAPVVAFC